MLVKEQRVAIVVTLSRRVDVELNVSSEPRVSMCADNIYSILVLFSPTVSLVNF